MTETSSTWWYNTFDNPTATKYYHNRVKSWWSQARRISEMPLKQNQGTQKEPGPNATRATTLIQKKLNFWARRPLGTKPGRPREGRRWHAGSTAGHAAPGRPAEPGQLSCAGHQAGSAGGNGGSSCHPSHAESHHGKVTWKVNSGATLLCLLRYAFTPAGHAGCLLCAGQDTHAAWVQFHLWVFLIWRNTQQSNKEEHVENTTYAYCICTAKEGTEQRLFLLLYSWNPQAKEAASSPQWRQFQ